ncbi:hypothetical protein RUM43_013368, partial [Polyplax serrata]
GGKEQKKKQREKKEDRNESIRAAEGCGWVKEVQDENAEVKSVRKRRRGHDKER